jgi:peptidyl-prolyl cis-trans isomerase D
VPEDELRKYYSENEKNFTTAEERRASHILVKDRAKADALLAELSKAPGSFADVARKNSQDSSTAANGGDANLFIGRKDTEKAYEDALFALKKPGDLSPVVETKDGFYILQLKAVRGGEKRSFESVRPELEKDRKTQLAQSEFAKAAAEFTNLVYEQSDSLKPAVDKLKLELRTAKGVTRTPSSEAAGPLGSKKLLDAIFSPDSLRNKRNTEAVETAPNTLVSARVVNHSPATTPALAEVKDKVRQKVAAQQAAAMARKEGEARLAELRKSPGTDLGTALQVVSRATTRELPRPVIDAALRLPTVPGAEGVSLGDEGFVVVRATKVLGRDPVVADPARAASQYGQGWASAEAQAYYAALKARFKVEVHAPAATDVPAIK